MFFGEEKKKKITESVKPFKKSFFVFFFFFFFFCFFFTGLWWHRCDFGAVTWLQFHAVTRFTPCWQQERTHLHLENKQKQKKIKMTWQALTDIYLSLFISSLVLRGCESHCCPLWSFNILTEWLPTLPLVHASLSTVTGSQVESGFGSGRRRLSLRCPSLHQHRFYGQLEMLILT